MTEFCKGFSGQISWCVQKFPEYHVYGIPSYFYVNVKITINKKERYLKK